MHAASRLARRPLLGLWWLLDHELWLIRYYVAQIEAVDIAIDLAINVSTAEDEDFKIVERGAVLAPPFWLEASCLDLDPGVFLDIEDVDVVEHCRRLAASNHAEMILVNHSSCMPGARFWRLLSRH